MGWHNFYKKKGVGSQDSGVGEKVRGQGLGVDRLAAERRESRSRGREPTVIGFNSTASPAAATSVRCVRCRRCAAWRSVGEMDRGLTSPAKLRRRCRGRHRGSGGVVRSSAESAAADLRRGNESVATPGAGAARGRRCRSGRGRATDWTNRPRGTAFDEGCIFIGVVVGRCCHEVVDEIGSQRRLSGIE